MFCTRELEGVSVLRSITIGFVLVLSGWLGWSAWQKAEPAPQPTRPHSWDTEEFWGTAEDLSRAVEASPFAEAGPDLVAPLDGEATLRIETRLEGGRPAAGLMVFARSRGVSLEATTRANGIALFENLPAGRYSLSVEGGEWRPLLASVPIDLTEGESRSVFIPIGKFDRTIRGRVLDAEGTPVEGIQVFARRRAPDPTEANEILTGHTPAWGKTDRYGEFAIEQLGHTEYLLSTRATSGQPAVHVILPVGTDTAELRLRALRTIEITGVVTDEEGHPLRGIKVSGAGSLARRAVTETNGSYRLTLQLDESDAREGNEKCAVIARGAGFLPVQAEVDIADRSPSATDATIPLDFILEAHCGDAVLRGLVVDAEGEPISGEAIALSSAEWGLYFELVSDENGKFAQPDIPFGNYRVEIYPTDRYSDLRETITLIEERDFDRPREREAPVERRVFTLLDLPLRSISGKILDPRGTPLPDFALTVASSSAVRNTHAIQSDARGEFILTGIAAGELRFEARGSYGLTITGCRLDLDGDAVVPLQLVADRGTRELRGTVLDQDGNAVRGAKVRLTWQHASAGCTSRSVRNTLADDRGGFRFGDLARAPYTLTVTASGHRASEQRIDLSGRRPDAIVHLWRE